MSAALASSSHSHSPLKKPAARLSACGQGALRVAADGGRTLRLIPALAPAPRAPALLSGCDYSAALVRNAVGRSFCQGHYCEGIFVNNATV